MYAITSIDHGDHSNAYMHASDMFQNRAALEKKQKGERLLPPRHLNMSAGFGASEVPNNMPSQISGATPRLPISSVIPIARPVPKSNPYHSKMHDMEQ